MPADAASQVRRLREARGLTQVALAEAAAISRQSLGAIEAGRADPSVSVALRLARALDCRVEDLFADPAPQPGLDVELAENHSAASGARRRVALAFVGERWVAHPLLAGSLQTAAHAADALTLPAPRQREGRARVELLRPPAEARETLLVSGCAPALGLLAHKLNSRPGPGRFLWLKHSSGVALAALAREHTHVGGVHLPESENQQAVRQHLPKAQLAIVTLAHWDAGLVVARGNPLRVRGAADLKRRGLRIASREAGASARVMLERALRAAGLVPEKVLHTSIELDGHLEVAHTIAIGAADVGIAMRPAALAFGLEFIPIASERFDLVFARNNLDDPRLLRMLDAMNSGAFRRELDAVGGYDTRCCGSVVQ